MVKTKSANIRNSEGPPPEFVLRGTATMGCYYFQHLIDLTEVRNTIVRNQSRGGGVCPDRDQSQKSGVTWPPLSCAFPTTLTFDLKAHACDGHTSTVAAYNVPASTFMLPRRARGECTLISNQADPTAYTSLPGRIPF